MWTDSQLHRAALWRRCCLWLLLVLPLLAGAQEGQYRSKIRIDPTAGLGQDSGLSIGDLEKQIDSIAEPYAKSSAGRHLARHYVEEGDYDKAVEYYRTALSANGLSDIANREMLRELAQVYLHKKDYNAAAATLERALRIKLAPEPTDYLLLAQAYYRLGLLAKVVAALDPIDQQGLSLSLTQKRQALALYYQAGAYPQCERILRQLLEVEPDNPDNWHQLASVLLQQGKRKQALDQLTLARDKAVPFEERDLLLLADLQAVNGNPYGAALTLEQALSGKRVTANGTTYRKLFQFWLQARERDRAAAALVKAAQLSGDIELYLYLAQLQMEQAAWRPMYQTMVAACSKSLQARYVGRANLLLGISQLKLGEAAAARRSFINATLIGGVGAQAGQWLDFMAAVPATAREAGGIVGICAGADDTRMSPGELAAAVAKPSGGGSPNRLDAETEPVAAVETKTVAPRKFFYLDYHKPLAELAGEARSLALAMGVALVKSGGSIDGPLQVVASGAGQETALQLGFPIRGPARAGGKYRLRTLEEFKCAYLVHDGEGESLATLWSEFLSRVQDSGLETTDERRLLFNQNRGEGGNLELQVGIQ